MSTAGGKIAVVSAALRLPGADSLATYWDGLLSGQDRITRALDDCPQHEQAPLGVPGNARFVPAYGRIAAPSHFDAQRYGMSPLDALLTDPQQRLLLEVVDEALHVGGVSAAARRATGVFVGTGLSSYETVVRNHLSSTPGVDDFAVELGSARDYVAGKIAYRFDLHGPTVNVLGACSTALLAVHLGCRALLAGDVDMAVAGASSVRFPEWTGYWAIPGSISSSDGVCRPFDARASGSVPGDGVGVVVLQRLDDALASGADVLAVICGSAANNDGRKPGFGNVSAASQEAVIRAALDAAQICPSAVAYVESHGSATVLGDAVEWSALHRIFGGNERPVQVGAVKGNIGHTREAAGIAGLLKAVQILRHGLIPPSANFATLRSDLVLPDTALHPVPSATKLDLSALDLSGPPVVGVSAFGLGGSNCHVVLQAAPPPLPAVDPTLSRSVVLLSSHRAETLDAETESVRKVIETATAEGNDLAGAQLAARSQIRAHTLPLRCYLSLNSAKSPRSRRVPKRPAKLVYAFPGVGSEYVGMVAGLREASEVFRTSVQDTAALADDAGVSLADVFTAGQENVPAAGGLDLRRMLDGGSRDVEGPMKSLPVRHLALFATQLALVDVLADAGIHPTAVLGHSLGEWTAATVSGAIARADAVRLVAYRAALIDQAPEGVTVAVAAGVDDLRPLLTDDMVLAADNSPCNCAVSGPVECAPAFEARLREAGLAFRRVGSGRAFHNRLLVPVAGELAEAIAKVRLGDARLDIASGLTGSWLNPGDLGAGYWQRQLTSCVRFHDALRAVASRYSVIVELGPGNITQWAAQTVPDVDVIRTTRLSYDGVPDVAVYDEALAELWLRGHDPRWPHHPAARPHRLPPGPPPALRRQVFDPRDDPPKAAQTSSPTFVAPGHPGGTTADVPEKAYEAGDFALAALTARLGEVWCALLRVADVQEDDHFFDIGGDSLLGRHLIAAIQAFAGVEVPASVVFACGSLRGMAGSINDWIKREGMP